MSKLAIRFGLGAVKAVGVSMIDSVVAERTAAGKFADLEDFFVRANPKVINKKAIEALAKSGSFDSLNSNRHQIFESSDLIAAYATERKSEQNSNQFSLFDSSLIDFKTKLELRNTAEWKKSERLTKEFEAFGFFLNEHPLDDCLVELQKRGVVLAKQLTENEDGTMLHTAGIIITIRHKSNARGRFAYLAASDPSGIFEASMFDEALITRCRDLLKEGGVIVAECLIKKDTGGTRVLIRDLKSLEVFLASKIQPIQPRKPKAEAKSKKRVANETDNLSAMPKSNLIEITLNKKDPISFIKDLLNQSSYGQQQVIFKIDNFALELANSYQLNEEDILNLNQIDGVVSAKIIKEQRAAGPAGAETLNK